MTTLEKVQRLYANYLEQAYQAQRAQKPLDGVLGLGSRVSDDPCHERFSTALEVLLMAAVQENLGSDEIRPVLEHIYRAPEGDHVPAAAYWMLVAVHIQTLELIGQLSREDAETLWTEYNSVYRRRDRLPAQKQVLDALDRVRKGK